VEIKTKVVEVTEAHLLDEGWTWRGLGLESETGIS
jgi:hypothetical protein